MPIIRIRPWRLFQQVEGDGGERIVNLRMTKRRDPERGDMAGTTLLESMILVACIKLTKAQRVFEIGTCLGGTTVNLALNMLPDGKVFTLDLDPKSAQGVVQTSPEDKGAARWHFEHPMEWTRPGLEHLPIVPLYGDSSQIDLSEYRDSIDLIWIDGGHEYPIVKSDSCKAQSMRRKDRLSCIAWHDYCNLRQSPDVTTYLDECAAAGEALYWVEDTLLVLHFNQDPFARAISSF